MPKRMLEGIVCSDVCDKTITVKTERLLKHPKYGKYITISKKYLAHDEENRFHVGDKVSIVETRPISKRKSWQVVYDNVK